MLYEFKIEKIKCQGCVESIQNSLSKLEGVKSVVADSLTKLVKVESQTTREEISQKLSELGFPESK